MAYTLTGRKGGTVRFVPMQNGLVEKESESYSSSVTSNPIENGSDINDHVNNDAGTFSISGVIVGGESAINALKAMRDSRDIITYAGVSRVTNLVFTSLKFDRTYNNMNGASFSATFKRIQTTSPEYIPAGESLPMTSQDAGKFDDQQLARTANAGLTTVALQSVSSSSLERHDAAYTQPSSTAPMTRLTGGYNGLAMQEVT